MSPRHQIVASLVLSGLWAVAFLVAVSIDSVYPVLGGVAGVVVMFSIVASVRRARSAGVSWWSTLRPRSLVVGLGVLVGLLTVAATHVGYRLIGASIPSLADDVERLQQVAAVTPHRLGLVVVIAVAEELIWRGLLLGALRRVGWSTIMATVSSACIYGLAQVGPRSLWLVVAACGLGVVWGALRCVGGPSGGPSGGLWRAIVAHLLWTIAILGVVPLR